MDLNLNTQYHLIEYRSIRVSHTAEHANRVIYDCLSLSSWLRVQVAIMFCHKMAQIHLMEDTKIIH